jgi:hypothetical protein
MKLCSENLKQFSDFCSENPSESLFHHRRDFEIGLMEQALSLSCLLLTWKQRSRPSISQHHGQYHAGNQVWVTLASKTALSKCW